MNIFKIFLLVTLVPCFAGCADMTLPTPKDIIEKPIGPDSVKIGMTKNEVKNLWGEPNQINYVKDKERWAGEREEWVYVGRYSALPVDADYFSKTRKLYFDGANLTNIVEE